VAAHHYRKPFDAISPGAGTQSRFIPLSMKSRVYRIDHYLGKETSQNILFFRFANTILNRLESTYVSNVQITVAESVDVGNRAGYYDTSGVIRDMFQNHLFQLLALVAMEPPSVFNADAMRNEKVKVFQSIRPIELEDTVRAQYEDYTQAEGVASDSQTPTYAAKTLWIIGAGAACRSTCGQARRSSARLLKSSSNFKVRLTGYSVKQIRAISLPISCPCASNQMKEFTCALKPRSLMQTRTCAPWIWISIITHRLMEHLSPKPMNASCSKLFREMPRYLPAPTESNPPGE
jgi:hypothetical protein